VSQDIYQRIYTIIGQIPAGRVASYGQIAKLAECGPRQVGYALRKLPKDTLLPWHRVINSQGKISQRPGEGENEQQLRLKEEGVMFSARGRINWSKHGFLEKNS